ncbi:hypothetical protein HK28_07345 [Acetobacter sp. DsW_063]|nr:hypothetical protein HK28_07345 [Acetobacter sp. DsW_063]
MHQINRPHAEENTKEPESCYFPEVNRSSQRDSAHTTFFIFIKRFFLFPFAAFPNLMNSPYFFLRS